MEKKLTSNVPFDSLKPDVVIGHFCTAIEVMKSKYEYDLEKKAELEAQLEDLLNYIEMAEVSDFDSQLNLYEKLHKVQNEIRLRTNEAKVLKPVYDLFNNDVVNMMMDTARECQDVKMSIGRESYTMKTSVMDNLFE